MKENISWNANTGFIRV